MPKHKRDSDEEENDETPDESVSDEPPKKKQKQSKSKKETGKKVAKVTEQESITVDNISFKVTGEDSWVELGLKGKKRLTVRKFKGRTLIDIREFYEDKNTGEMKPGSKGISLTADEWFEVVRVSAGVDNLVAKASE